MIYTLAPHLGTTVSRDNKRTIIEGDYNASSHLWDEKDKPRGKL